MDTKHTIMPKQTFLPTPICTEYCSFADLPEHYQKAAFQASDCIDPEDWEKASCRLETYSRSSIVKMVNKIWGWSATIEGVKQQFDPTFCHTDIARIRKIMRLIRKGEPQWPYVSYWAHDMKELCTVEPDGAGDLIVNHGDGWHRIIAANELKLPTIDILFAEKKS